MRTEIVIVFVIFAVVCCDAKPYRRQVLPPMPGYVPVYILNGDTPLEEINLELAEAFHAIPSGRSAGGSDIMAESNDHEERTKKQPKAKKHVSKRAINWSEESLEDEDLEIQLNEALSRPDQNYERSLDMQVLNIIEDK